MKVIKKLLVYLLIGMGMDSIYILIKDIND